MTKWKEDPALRQEMQLEYQRKFEAQQDVVFQQMQDSELLRIYGMGSMYQEIKAHKRFWEWRKHAVLEFQQLRETQRLSREQLSHSDTFIPALEEVTWDPADAGESNISIMLKYTSDTTKILPITTPAAFALKQQHTSDRRPWSRSGTKATASPFGQPPGKRFPFGEMSQIQCKPKHYRWLQESVRLRLVKGLSYDDQTPQNRLGPWSQLAKLMWKSEAATDHIVKNNDRR